MGDLGQVGGVAGIWDGGSNLRKESGGCSGSGLSLPSSQALLAVSEAVQKAYFPCKKSAIKKRHFLCQKHDYQWECQVESSLLVTLPLSPGAAAVVFHGNLVQWEGASWESSDVC